MKTQSSGASTTKMVTGSPLLLTSPVPRLCPSCELDLGEGTKALSRGEGTVALGCQESQMLWVLVSILGIRERIHGLYHYPPAHPHPHPHSLQKSPRLSWNFSYLSVGCFSVEK